MLSVGDCHLGSAFHGMFHAVGVSGTSDYYITTYLVSSADESVFPQANLGVWTSSTQPLKDWPLLLVVIQNGTIHNAASDCLSQVIPENDDNHQVVTTSFSGPGFKHTHRVSSLVESDLHGLHLP